MTDPTSSGDLTNCDSTASGAGSHGNVIANIILGNPSHGIEGLGITRNDDDQDVNGEFDETCTTTVSVFDEEDPTFVEPPDCPAFFECSVPGGVPVEEVVATGCLDFGAEDECSSATVTCPLIDNAQPGEVMLTTMNSVINIFYPEFDPYLRHTSTIPGSSRIPIPSARTGNSSSSRPTPWPKNRTRFSPYPMKPGGSPFRFAISATSRKISEHRAPGFSRSSMA